MTRRAPESLTQGGADIEATQYLDEIGRTVAALREAGTAQSDLTGSGSTTDRLTALESAVNALLGAARS